MRRMLVFAVVTLCLWSQVAVAEIQESGTKESQGSSPSSTWSDAGWGSLAVLTNLLYMPAKIVYGTVGLVTGSLAYLCTVGNDDVAMSIWDPSLGGTWVVSPAILRGDEPMLFSGPSHSKS